MMNRWSHWGYWLRQRVLNLTPGLVLLITIQSALAQPQARPTPSPSPTPVQSPATLSPATPAGAVYQVIVTQTSDTALRTAQGLDSSAYRGSYQGQPVIFAGVYRDLSNASQQTSRLARSGLSPLVIRRQPASFRVAVLVPDTQTVGELRANLRRVQGLVPDAYLDTFQEQSVIVAGQFREAAGANTLASRLQALGYSPLLITVPEAETVLLPSQAN
ncbi:hypothetical protein [Leptolyngbya sp. FACHB-261]|uniref:hypothetical protein n=1 Tax=Leptolyngbya sp. FACHB-261 TaxID=2692806 RepID=UPI0016836BBC|nr:hypothetical protein [Leptolyngbya sp. FACHB-261]